MRVLLTNDDGPLNDEFSGYIRPFAQYLKKHYPHWDLTICVPHVQKSWIGKAHLAGKKLTAQFLYSKLSSPDNSFIGPFIQPQAPCKNSKLPRSIANPDVSRDDLEWILIDGTPASCANIGLYHMSDTPFDLVISGPNVGRNTSTAYITSSGTVGAAMESVITGNTKSIALSWAYFDGRKNVASDILEMAAKRSLEVIDHLWHNWNDDTDFYSVNIPLCAELNNHTKALYTSLWDNRWNAVFNGPIIGSNARNSENEIEDGNEYQMITFEWAPDFKHHTDSKYHDKGLMIDKDVIESKMISVTPLRATFLNVGTVFGELSLLKNKSSDVVAITIDPQDYIYGPLRDAIEKYLPNVELLAELPSIEDSKLKIFHYGDYEQLDMDQLSTNENNYFANSYIYRKALIRKHYLAQTIHSYVVKNPDSILSEAFLDTYSIDLDYAEFLDDSLDENWELRQELEKNEKWWIVKPSMSDKGQGIRVFRTEQDLQAVFDSFDEDETDDESEIPHDDNKIIISQLRHFIIQEYLENPLLLPSMNNKKFHIRCYISCRGSLEVYVYDRMLALFASKPFEKLAQNSFNPTNIEALKSHLTNTCLQSGNEEKNISVVEFDELSDISKDGKQTIKKQIYQIAHDLFLAAIKVDSFGFRPLPNAFETFGVDFLVDSNLQVKLLEVNAYPDFKQTGEETKDLITELFDNCTKHFIAPFFNVNQNLTKSANKMIKVLDYATNNWQ